MMNFTLFKRKQDADYILKKINKCHENKINYRKTEQNNQISFLNVLVNRDKSNNKYNTTISKKTTNINLSLLFERNQCKKYKLNFIRSPTIRVLPICSSEKGSHRELQQ